MKNRFVLGLATALVLGFFVNIIFGYIKFGYFQNPEKVLGGLSKIFNGANPENNGKPIDKDIKDCRDLVPGATTFGKLEVMVQGNEKPLENLEVDLGTKPGPVRCIQKTDKDGVVLFGNVPTGQMFIFFNQGASPKEFGQMPTETVEIVEGKLLEKTIKLKSQ